MNHNGKVKEVDSVPLPLDLSFVAILVTFILHVCRAKEQSWFFLYQGSQVYLPWYMQLTMFSDVCYHPERSKKNHLTPAVTAEGSWPDCTLPVSPVCVSFITFLL